MVAPTAKRVAVMKLEPIAARTAATRAHPQKSIGSHLAPAPRASPEPGCSVISATRRRAHRDPGKSGVGHRAGNLDFAPPAGHGRELRLQEGTGRDLPRRDGGGLP